jgi:hypothetical protein
MITDNVEILSKSELIIIKLFSQLINILVENKSPKNKQ